MIKNLAVFPKGVWLARQARSRGIDHIHAHWATATATMAMVASHVSGIPWSFTAHRYDIVENNLLARKVNRARFVRFISQSGYAMAFEHCGPLIQGKARVLHMGVDVPGKFATVADHTESSGDFVVLCPANLVPVKGQRYLIAAATQICKAIPNLQVWLAGSGPMRAALEHQVRTEHLETVVKFLDQMPHKELLQLYEQGKVACTVLPSLDLGHGNHEGIPVSLMEAMAYGVPVVSTRTGGIPELLDGGAGVLVPPADANAVASAVVALFTDPEHRRQTGEAGYRQIVKSFSALCIAKELERLCLSRTV